MWKSFLQLPGSIYILCLGTFINRAGTFLLVFMTLYLESRLNLGVQKATIAMGIAAFGSLLAGLIGGHLADRFGRRPVMLTALVGGAVVMLLFGYLSSAPLIMAALFLFTLISDMYRPAVMAMIADLVEPERRPQAFAIMYVAINLGFAVAPLIGGRLVELSYMWLFRLDALTTLAYAFIIFVAIRETLPSKVKRRARGGEGFLKDGSAPPANGLDAKSDTAGSATAVADHPPHQQVALFQAMKYIASDFTFMRFATGLLLVSIVFMQSQSTLPLYMKSLGFSEKDFGDVVFVNGLLIVLLQLPLTMFLARFPRALLLMTAAVFVGVGFGAVEWSVTKWHFRATVVVWTIGEIMQAPLLSAIVGDLAPVHLRARYMGVLTMCFSMAGVLGQPIGGFVFSQYGPTYVWLGGVVVAAMAAVMFASIGKELSRRHSEHEMEVAH